MVPVPKANVARKGSSAIARPSALPPHSSGIDTGRASANRHGLQAGGVDAYRRLFCGTRNEELTDGSEVCLHRVIHTQEAIRQPELRIQLDGVFQQFLEPRNRFRPTPVEPSVSALRNAS